ncbi:MAG: dihydroorotase [Bacteroidaceae bacterium]|nr:dihydroorotase [Bacteroidaceae bacterium]
MDKSQDIWLIRNGLLVGGGSCRRGDVLVSQGRIARVGQDLPRPEGARVVDATDCVVTYGLADVHVHLREPGYSHKETILTGTRAAAHGGYTTVCAMPNLNPAPDSPDTLGVELDLIRRQAVVEVKPYATITLGRQGQEVVDMAALKPLVAGFSDDGSGVQADGVMLKAMQQAARLGCTIAAHCEDNSLLRGGYIHDGAYARRHGHKGICSESEWRQIERDIALAEQTGCHYHVCHISTRESVDLIRQAQRRGVNVTCETAPHYLVLTDADLQEDGRFKMNPPLRSADDRAALIEGLQDGTVTCMATDHAPHTAEEKSRGLAGSAMGIVGLETAWAVAYTHLVRKGLLPLERLVDLLCDNPRRVFRLGGGLGEGEAANLAVFDVKTPYRIDSSQFLSMGHSTPFDGWEVYGRCVLTLYEGRAVWQEEN